MDTGLDTGNIVQQEPLTLPDGISGQEADVATATLGGHLLVKALNQLTNGTFTSIPQPTGGSNHPWPQPADFRIPVSWSARHAFNFMRGTTEFGQPFVIEMEKGEIKVKTAVSFSQGTILNQPYQTDRDKIQIQFTDGMVTAVFNP